MNDKVKKKVLESLHEVYLEIAEDHNPEIKYNGMSDILNLIKIVEDWEELTPDIKRMLDDKAYKDKWKNKER